MTDEADAPLNGVWTEAPAESRRIGTILAGAVALAASAALAWWAAGPDRTGEPAPPAPAPAVAQAPEPAPAPLRYAPDEPDPRQVKEAWRKVQTAFIDGGAQALVQGSLACAKETPADPRRLDYCLAFDDYAEEIVRGAPDAAAQADWFSGAADRDLALAQSVLPAGVEAANRLAQVSALTTAVLPKPKPAPKPKAKPRPKPKRHALRAHAARHVRHAPQAKAHAAPSPERSAAAPPDADAPWAAELPPH